MCVQLCVWNGKKGKNKEVPFQALLTLWVQAEAIIVFLLRWICSYRRREKKEKEKEWREKYSIDTMIERSSSNTSEWRCNDDDIVLYSGVHSVVTVVTCDDFFALLHSERGKKNKRDDSMTGDHVAQWARRSAWDRHSKWTERRVDRPYIGEQAVEAVKGEREGREEQEKVVQEQYLMKYWLMRKEKKKKERELKNLREERYSPSGRKLVAN